MTKLKGKKTGMSGFRRKKEGKNKTKRRGLVAGYLWIEIGSLLHERADGKPETVGQRKVISAADQLMLFRRMRLLLMMLLLVVVGITHELVAVMAAASAIVPFVGRESSHHPHGQGNEDVGQSQKEPNLQSQRIHKREESARRRRRHLIFFFIHFRVSSSSSREIDIFKEKGLAPVGQQLYIYILFKCVFVCVRVREKDLWIESTSLAQKGARNEPETIGDGELILDDIALGVARVRVVPLVRRESRHYKQSETHQDVGRHHVLLVRNY